MVWSTLEPRVPANEMIDMLTDRKAPNREDRMKLTERRVGGARRRRFQGDVKRAEVARDEQVQSSAILCLLGCVSAGPRADAVKIHLIAFFQFSALVPPGTKSIECH